MKSAVGWKACRLTVVALLLGTSVGCASSSLGWQVGRARTEAYAMRHEVGLRPDGQPEELKAQQLELVLDGQGQARVRLEGKDVGTYPISEGGHLSLDGRAVPPYEVVVLTSLLPPGGRSSPQVGDTWETLFPLAGPGPQDDGKLFLQDRYQVRVLALREEGGAKLADLSIRGDVRLLPNALYRKLQASLTGTDRAELDAFGTFQANLDGTATFDMTSGRLRAAELSVLLMPRTDVAHDAIATNPHRRRITASAR